MRILYRNLNDLCSAHRKKKKISSVHLTYTHFFLFVVCRNGYRFDNKDVVPYNPHLLYKYDCHINVEVCNSVKAVKYLFKYVYKGHDRAEVAVVPANAGSTSTTAAAGAAPRPVQIDEIKQYVDGRYVSASEAFWRIYGFRMHGQFPSVERLPVHLDKQQIVYFAEDANVANILPKMTKLEAWFDYNAKKVKEYQDAMDADLPAVPDPALSTTYQNFPTLAVWDAGKPSATPPVPPHWKPRQQGQVVGRM